MSERFDITTQDMYNDYLTAKALGSAMLGCNGMLIPVGMPQYALLIKAFPRPVITRNEPAEVNYAGGMQTGVVSTPKTYYEGSITLIETDSGQGLAFAEWANAIGEHDFIMYDGRIDRHMRSHQMFNAKVTLEPFDMDGENRSTIVTMTGTIKYNYFGMTVNNGSTSGKKVTDMKNDAVSKFASTASKTLATVLSGLKMQGAIKSAGINGGITEFGRIGI